MKHLGSWSLAIAAFAVLPLAAQAQQLAYLSQDANLRAGPDRDYPVVTVLPNGMEVAVQGCVPDYSWCDIVAGPTRGWVYGGYIAYPYQGSNVPILTYGSVLGIGVGAFVISDYWDRYYRARPWYGQRQHWIGYPPPGFRPGWNRPAPSFGQAPGFGGPRPGPGPGNGFHPGQRPGHPATPPNALPPAQAGIPGGNRPPHNNAQESERPHDRVHGGNHSEQGVPRNGPRGPSQRDRPQGEPSQGDRHEGGHRRP